MVGIGIPEVNFCGSSNILITFGISITMLTRYCHVVLVKLTCVRILVTCKTY